MRGVSHQIRERGGCSFRGMSATLRVENRTGVRTPSLYGMLGMVGCRIRVIPPQDVGPKIFD